jgi:hypothetical protein
MFRIADIEDEARKIIGVCDDRKLLRWCGDVVSMIANKGDFEGFKAWLDICVSSTDCQSDCITLPREVETVIAVNIGGKPTLGYGTLFNFHLNGMGDCKTRCDWSWQDQGAWHHTYRDLAEPKKLIAMLQTADDNNKELIVYGYDSEGNKLRREKNGVWLDGYQVPTIYGVAVPDTIAPTIARITGIYKEGTAGSIKLATQDNILLGVFEPDENIPQYRRIKINRKSNWVRIAYIRNNPVFQSIYDHIPLRSRVGFLLGMQARKHYSADKLAEAQAFELNATRLEIEAQQKAEPMTTVSPIQVMDGEASLNDRGDYHIV